MTNETLRLTTEWDKTFTASDAVTHEKVTFHNRYGITLAADLYRPAGASGPYAALAVCGPFGAVKEQCSGLYAQTMAERGFLAIAFDPSYTGESGGEPRYMASPDINTEDFMAAVDYLSCRDDVDAQRVGGVVDPLPDDAPFYVRDYYDYYKTPRGYHPRSLNSNEGWNVTGCMSFLNQPILAYASEIEGAVMVLHGDAAHSFYMGRDAFSLLKGDNKVFEVVPGAVHTDLYDGGGKDAIPWDKIESFLRANLG